MAKKLPSPPEQELIKLRNVDHLTVAEIGKHYGVCVTTVIRWYRVINEGERLPTLPKIGISDTELVTLHQNGETLKSIAHRFNCSRVTLSRRLKKVGVTPTRRSGKGEESVRLPIDDVHKLHLDGMSCVALGNKFGCTDITIAKRLRKYGKSVIDRNYGFQQSEYEKELHGFLSQHGLAFDGNRKLLSNRREVDLYNEGLGLGIEFCGVYWHNEDHKSKRWHFDKMLECRELGIRLLTIFENEYLERPDIVRSIILSKCGMFERRVYARQCTLIAIGKKEAHTFLANNHLQGGLAITHAFGLLYDDELIGVMTFSRHHRQNGNTASVLSRLCFKQRTQVVGGASRLFKHAMREIPKPIISWSDNRWSDGGIYRELGFTLDVEYGPDYQYQKGPKLYPKQKFQKKKIGCPSSRTEHDFCYNELGLRRIYDCGKIRWIFN